MFPLLHNARRSRPNPNQIRHIDREHRRYRRQNIPPVIFSQEPG